MNKELRRIKAENKPWAKLRVSRRQYEANRPWKRAGMSRELFEEVVLAMSDGMIDEIKLNGQVDKLMEGIFGNNNLN